MRVVPCLKGLRDGGLARVFRLHSGGPAALWPIFCGTSLAGGSAPEDADPIEGMLRIYTWPVTFAGEAHARYNRHFLLHPTQAKLRAVAPHQLVKRNYTDQCCEGCASPATSGTERAPDGNVH